MRWTPGGRSENLEDRRGASGGFGGFGGGRGLGLGGIVILLVLSLIFKQDFLSLAGGGGAAGAPAAGPAPINDPAEEKSVQFLSFVLDDAQDTVWAALLPQTHEYRATAMLAWCSSVTWSQSACGIAQAASGPFYCPADQQGLRRPLLLGPARDRWARRASSPRPTCSPTSSGTMCRRCSARRSR